MDVYNSEDSSDLVNLPLLYIEWTLIVQFWFLVDYVVLLDASIFTTIDGKKEEQMGEGCYWGKKCGNSLNTVNSW